jgi:hypothetical protein
VLVITLALVPIFFARERRDLVAEELQRPSMNRDRL